MEFQKYNVKEKKKKNNSEENLSHGKSNRGAPGRTWWLADQEGKAEGDTQVFILWGRVDGGVTTGVSTEEAEALPEQGDLPARRLKDSQAIMPEAVEYMNLNAGAKEARNENHMHRS